MMLISSQKQKRSIYYRWSQINGRCQNKKNHDYRHYGAQGITVAWDWHRGNPDGFENFYVWLLGELGQQTDPKAKNVGLRPGARSYCAANCVLRTHAECVQGGLMATLTTEQVIAIRKLKCEHPEYRVKDIIAQLKLRVTVPAVSNALTGVTFPNLNALATPHLGRRTLAAC